MNASACIELCRREPACEGVTLSETEQSGLDSCYVLSEIARWDREPGYASWTKRAIPPAGNTPAASTVEFGPTGGRSSDPILPFFAVAGATDAVIFSIGRPNNPYSYVP